MEQKVFLFTAIPLLAVITIFGYLNFAQSSSLNQPIETQEQCQQIQYNGEDRLNLVFISSRQEAEHYTQVMFSTEPFKSYNDYFNVYVVEEEPECEYYKGIAILCNTKQVQSLAKNCPHDYIIAVKTDSKNIRSSAYGNVMSINSVHEDSVLIHELGHTIANLAEEYGGAKIPSGSKNCVSSCDKFIGEIDSCELECSESSYYRSIEEGVMRTLKTPNYGVYNIKLISDLLDKNKPSEPTITGNQISESISCDQKIIQAELIQSESNAQVLTNNILLEGCAPQIGLAGALCVDSVCNINTLFTDSQDIQAQENLEGETYLNPQTPLVFYIKQNLADPLIDVTLDNQLIKTVNTLEAGKTACKI